MERDSKTFAQLSTLTVTHLQSTVNFVQLELTFFLVTAGIRIPYTEIILIPELFCQNSEDPTIQIPDTDAWFMDYLCNFHQDFKPL